MRSEAVAPRARDRDTRRLGFSLLDQLAATAFTGPDARDVVELTRSAAAALAEEDLDAARASRRRMIARVAAIERTTLTAVIGMLGERARGDLREEHDLRIVRLLDALASSSCRRLTMLLGAAEQRTAAVSIENALVRVESE